MNVKYWEIIADNLSKAGWTWDCVSAIDASERTIWITDAHLEDGRRFIVHAEEKLTAFLELHSAIRKRVLTLSVRGWQDSIRAKSVGRLPKSST